MKTKIISIIYLFLVSFSFSQSKNLDYLEQEKNKVDENILLLKDSIKSLTKYSNQLEENIKNHYLTELNNSKINDSEITGTIKSETYLLKEPHTFSEKLLILEVASEVKIIDYSDFYFKIYFGSQIGYINGSNVKGNHSFDAYIEMEKQKTLDKISIIEKKFEEEKKYNDTNGSKEKEAIIIEGIRVPISNSAGGIDFIIQWRFNDISKTIKYIYFTVIPYNDVGDIQTGSIGRHSSFTGKETGPIKARDWINESRWGNAWYNGTITCVKITKVRVVYMDGSTYTYIKELHKILDDSFSNDCNYVD